jgi:hypothetical protein
MATRKDAVHISLLAAAARGGKGLSDAVALVSNGLCYVDFGGPGPMRLMERNFDYALREIYPREIACSDDPVELLTALADLTGWAARAPATTEEDTNGTP